MLLGLGIWKQIPLAAASTHDPGPNLGHGFSQQSSMIALSQEELSYKAIPEPMTV